MVKMVSYEKTGAEKGDEDRAGGEPGMPTAAIEGREEGPTMHMNEHHLEVHGLEHPLPVGTKVKFHGHGEVVDMGSHKNKVSESGESGEVPDARHHMTIKFHKGGLEHEEAESEDGKGRGGESDVRKELKKNMAESEKRDTEKRDGKEKEKAM